MPKQNQSLIIIALVQLAATLLIYNKLATIDGESAMAEVARPDQIQRHDIGSAQSAASVTVNSIIAEQLRQIIREELATQFENRQRAASEMEQVVTQGSVDWSELEGRRLQVSHQLDYYTSVGSISEADMQKLQSDIARLDPGSRQQMLMELNRALNSGRIKGRL